MVAEDGVCQERRPRKSDADSRVPDVVDDQLVVRDGHVLLQSAIALRNPYVDPLSLLQISLLRRKRTGAAKTEREKEAVGDALATTLSGIAQGLRNTG